MFISCPDCRTRFKLDEKRVSSAGVKLKCSKCSGVMRLAADRKLRAGRQSVLVAHESVEFCHAVQTVLDGQPFDMIASHDGKEALDLALKLLPDVVLLNVALPTMYGFQVCEALRAAPVAKDVKIILLAAIYDKTKYKRSPQSLYGADDYIEQHHIPDALVPMIYRLTAVADNVSGQSTASAAGDDAAPQAAVSQTEKFDREEDIRNELIAQQTAKDVSDVEHLSSAARQLARSIVADISLYREAELEEAVRTGEIETCLGVEIKDGRAIFESRLPEHSSLKVDFYAEALAELISLKKREMGII